MSNETDIQELRGADWMRANPRCHRCGHRHPDNPHCYRAGPTPRLIIEIAGGLVARLIADQEIEAWIVDTDIEGSGGIDGEEGIYAVAPDGHTEGDYQLAYVECRSTVANPDELVPYWNRIIEATA